MWRERHIGLRPDNPAEPVLAMVKNRRPRARLDWHLLTVPWYDGLSRLSAACAQFPMKSVDTAATDRLGPVVRAQRSAAAMDDRAVRSMRLSTERFCNDR